MKVKEHMILAQELENAVVEELKAMHKIKRMSKLQRTVAEDLVTQIMSNEEPSKWLSAAKNYCANPEDKNHERVSHVNKIAVAHKIDNYLASLLLASKIDAHEIGRLLTQKER